MSGKSLTTVSFPTNLLREVDSLVRKSGKYMNRADFCRASVRQLIVKETIIIGGKTVDVVKGAID